MKCSLQIACNKDSDLPTKAEIQNIMNLLATEFDLADRTFTIRIVNQTESQHLNKTFRNKDKPTNVLSFPGTDDLALCHPIIVAEAEVQHKPIKHHYTHLVMHGVLHLLGYDHEQEHDAIEMETLEIDLLKYFNIPNPYEDNHRGP